MDKKQLNNKEAQEEMNQLTLAAEQVRGFSSGSLEVIKQNATTTLFNPKVDLERQQELIRAANIANEGFIYLDAMGDIDLMVDWGINTFDISLAEQAEPTKCLLVLKAFGLKIKEPNALTLFFSHNKQVLQNWQETLMEAIAEDHKYNFGFSTHEGNKGNLIEALTVFGFSHKLAESLVDKIPSLPDSELVEVTFEFKKQTLEELSLTVNSNPPGTGHRHYSNPKNCLDELSKLGVVFDKGQVAEFLTSFNGGINWRRGLYVAFTQGRSIGITPPFLPVNDYHETIAKIASMLIQFGFPPEHAKYTASNISP